MEIEGEEIHVQKTVSKNYSRKYRESDAHPGNGRT